MKTFQASRLVTRLLAFLVVIASQSNCTKEYSIEGGNAGAAAGKWEFSEGGSNFRGPIDSAYIIKDATINELHLVGVSSDNKDKFHLVIYADTIKTGSYLASTFNTTFDYGNREPYIYSAGQLTGEFTVKIVSINKNVISGLFSGEALKDGSESANIQNGLFTASLAELIEAPPSKGVLGNESGNCLPIKINGTYRQGADMNPSNTIEVEVNVTETGSYHIYSDTVNGVTFSSKGEFTTRGQQTIILSGSGIPAFSGIQEFTVHYGDSQCAFEIPFAEAAATYNDYFPTTNESWWEYTDNAQTFYYKVLPDVGIINGQSYKIIGQFQSLTGTDYDTAFTIRKNSGNYFNIIDYSLYTGGLVPDKEETIFLKDNISKGAFWNGPEFTNTVAGIPVKFYLKFTITDKEVSENISGFTFPDVIKVKAELFSGSTNAGISSELWFARNVGLVYSKDMSGNEIIIKDFRIF